MHLPFHSFIGGPPSPARERVGKLLQSFGKDGAVWIWTELSNWIIWIKTKREFKYKTSYFTLKSSPERRKCHFRLDSKFQNFSEKASPRAPLELCVVNNRQVQLADLTEYILSVFESFNLISRWLDINSLRENTTIETLRF
jgi:hypothetical protein